MARVTGLEPEASGVTGRRSNQLSYTRAGSGGRIRTYDQRINSPLRYRCATPEESALIRARCGVGKGEISEKCRAGDIGRKTERAPPFPAEPFEFGGAKEDRTPDLYNAIVALSQLSYGPEFSGGREI